MAKKQNKIIAFEYHRESLTENKESALKLVQDIDKDNIKLYWQPNPQITIEEQISEIELLFSYIVTIHCFNWDKNNIRYPFINGEKNWKLYYKYLSKNNKLNYLLEFCVDDLFITAQEDLKILKTIVK